MSHVTYRSRQQYLCFLTLDVTVLVPVGTQLHGRDSHAGLGCQLAPDSGWDSHAGTSLLTSWYLAFDGWTPTLVLKHSDLDLTVIQLSYPAAINDPGYAQINPTSHCLITNRHVSCLNILILCAWYMYLHKDQSHKFNR